MLIFALNVQLASVASERQALLDLWDVRQKEFSQCMDLQMFLREVEQANDWISKQEASHGYAGFIIVSTAGVVHNTSHFSLSRMYLMCLKNSFTVLKGIKVAWT